MITVIALSIFGAMTVVYCANCVLQWAVYRQRVASIATKAPAPARTTPKSDTPPVRSRPFAPDAAGTMSPVDMVVNKIVEMVIAGSQVCDLDIPLLVETTGQPVEIVIEALDEVSRAWDGGRSNAP
jgi:hypothetical protein